MDSDWSKFLETVAVAKEAEPIFDALRDIVNARVGNRLMTASVYDIPSNRSRRVYSENKQAYPVGGFKPIAPGKWTDTVIRRHEVFSSLTIEDIAEVFFDWQLIQSLGVESNMNMPVIVSGEIIGSVNLLERKGFYTPEKVAAAKELLPFATVAFLFAHRAGALAWEG